jgi:excinuclease ABC subunit A
MKFITIKGAREHNLKNIDLTIPRDKVTVITGLSGSGKSSLAFDTIYAEGQRRYVESLSPYARQFLEKMKKPDVDQIKGLSPSISIDQKHTSHNPRSTVGTIAEVYDYIRLLFAKVGDRACYECGREISAASAEKIVENILALEDGLQLTIVAPLVRDRKGEFREVLANIKKRGFSKIDIDGVAHDLKDEIKLRKNQKHTINVIIDRVINGTENKDQLEHSVALALEVGEHVCIVRCRRGAADQRARKQQILTFSEHLFCPHCNIGFEEMTPNSFSFNSSLGACPTCKGIGVVSRLVKNYIIIDENKPLLGGAINKEIYFSFNKYFIKELIQGLKSYYHFDLTTPFKALPTEVQEAFFWGNSEYCGILDELKEQLHRTESATVKDKIRTFLKEETCPDCKGGRLDKRALGVTFLGKNIIELGDMSIDRLNGLFAAIKLTKMQMKLAETILKEIAVRLRCLAQMGLGYLTLNRSAATLAGGEMQRVRLASQIGTGLTGILYVLDEPSIGLHARDNERLLTLIKELKDLHNTVVIVEHDEETILRADHVVDLGPGAGEAGGMVVFSESQENIARLKNTGSLTLDYLRGVKKIAVPRERLKSAGRPKIRLKGAAEHNLKNITVDIPLGLFICVAGVSGSGKSTLVHDVLYKALHNKIWGTDYAVGKVRTIEGMEHVDKVVEIDQSPIGRTPRSNPATYSDLFSHIRGLFSQLPDAKIKGFGPGRFSFNVKGGRCEACEGAGMQRIEMSFLPDVSVLCDVCRGQRFDPETLTIEYHGKTIADVLEMQVSEALEFFDPIPQVRERLNVLNDVGLGYIKLGQSSTTLSGGEAQRIKIAFELCKRATGRTIYLLDEPTTGLHFADIQHLLNALFKIRDQGNTVIVIEHNLDVIKTADHVIDLGPEGGEEGGYVVASGTPEEVARTRKSYTGQYLKKILQ